MHARRLLAGLATTAVAVSALALTGAPASAVTSNPQPDDTAGTPVAANLIGVGSDTSQRAVKLTADGFNATGPAATVFTYAACATADTCGTVTLPSGDKPRPNGSGAGRNLLNGSGNNPDIDFARSSSPISSTEVANGLQMFPFAVDTLVMATSASTNAPASLTAAQVVGIYDGTYTTWNQVGGTSTAAIKAKIPQGGSGTRSFFVAQLKAANSNKDVVISPSIPEVQEHDPAAIQGDPDAIAPFSKGRAALAGTLRIEAGDFSYDRALYNVVRAADVTNAQFTAYMGAGGYLCSPAATAAIEASGFRQLKPESQGGVCGVATQTATSNFVTSVVSTTTAVTVTSPVANQARVVAKISAASAPSGRVSFFEGTTQIAANVPLVSGQATITPAATPGSHTYRAVFTPGANSSFQGSEGTGTGTVSSVSSTTPTTKASSSLSAAFAKKVFKGKKLKGTITVKLNGSSAQPSGAVTVKLGAKTVATGNLSGGKATIQLKGLKVGKNKLTATWAGDANGNAGSTSFTVKVVKKPTKK